MIIPASALSDEVLIAIIEEYVLREGTEYGLQEVSLADKIGQVKHQLAQGSVVLVYSELHQTVNILPKEQLSASGAEEQTS